MATKTQTLGVNAPATNLSNEEILRYSRHLIMPEVGMEGQLKLKNAKVLLIGTGGLAGVVTAGMVLQHPLRTNWLLFFILILIVGLQFILVGVVAYKVERINVNLRFRGQLESIHDDPGS